VVEKERHKLEDARNHRERLDDQLEKIRAL
jgi:hypothetical protein